MSKNVRWRTRESAKVIASIWLACQLAVAVHAGTCMSTRLRGEPNGYNQLHIDGDRVRIIHRGWDGARFVDIVEKQYRRTERGGERIIKEPFTQPPRYPQLHVV